MTYPSSGHPASASRTEPPRCQSARGFSFTTGTTVSNNDNVRCVTNLTVLFGRTCHIAVVSNATATEGNTMTILDEIRTFLRRFIVFSTDELELVVALWILHTHTFMESFPRTPWVTPYLYVYSETPGAGKTTVIRVCHTLVYNPEIAGDMTSAAMFTMIGGGSDDDDEIESQGRPTLLIDEIDTVFNGSGAGNQAMRRTLNTGYEASGYAVRKIGKEAVKFSTFCAKLLAGINGLDSDLPETVRTRSIPVKLVKARPPERFYSFKAGPAAEELVQRISAWVRANAETIIDYEPEEIESMEPRAFEISFPLLQLAHALGVETETRTALIRLLAPPAPKDRPEIAMLRAIREAFDEDGTGRLHTAQILDKLGESWNGKLLNNRLNGLVEGGTATISIPGRKPAKGYYRHQFQTAFDRHLS